MVNSHNMELFVMTMSTSDNEELMITNEISYMQNNYWSFCWAMVHNEQNAQNATLGMESVLIHVPSHDRQQQIQLQLHCWCGHRSYPLLYRIQPSLSAQQISASVVQCESKYPISVSYEARAGLFLGDHSFISADTIGNNGKTHATTYRNYSTVA